MVAQKRQGGFGKIATGALHRVVLFLVLTIGLNAIFTPASAQSYAFSTIVVEGNERIEPATIVKFAGITRGQPVSAGGLNDAFQRLTASGLFASVEVIPSGSTLILRVRENPTINIVNFEGNERIKDEDLAKVVQSKSNRVYTISQAEADAAAITQIYADQSRLAARVEPRIIDRGDNRVDLVFEVREGRVTEVDRLSFTGNRSYSDRRLRQVLGTKQAGLLRNIIQRDTFIPDRIEFDKQVLTDFYRSRGFIDFQVLGVSSEFSRERDSFFLTFNVREGLSYKFGKITAVSEYEGVDVAPYEAEIRIRPGVTYSPLAVDTTISRMEAVALKQGIDFVSIVPRITRNERDQTLDVVFAVTKGPRVFVERIDIEGNATTLDKVIRRQFRIVEGDPFNPREIRQAAERTRALDFFATTDVQAKPGTQSDQVIVDVNVEEKPTGSLSFGASYSVSDGVGFNVSLSEGNFLGRGQFVGVSIATASDTQANSITFIEPAFLGRDLRFRFNAFYNTTDNDNSFYNTQRAGFTPSIEFPISEFGRLELRYKASNDKIFDVDPVNSSALLVTEQSRGSELTSGFGYTYSYDTRIGGINPKSNVSFRFGQDFAGFGGDIESITTTALAIAQTKAFREEVTLRAELEGGVVYTRGGNSRLIDRFTGNGKIRGFEPNGYGPRDLTATNLDAVGGNYFAALRLEAEFPLGLPEEYGLTGGLFADVGSVWGLDDNLGGIIDDDLHLRSSIGFSIFWTTAIGPLRFNFSHALGKESYDKVQNFDLTVSTRF
ncbi:MAG: outer membrane protein assembly factor BamA [Paracoccaceae bacterium]